MKNLQVTSYKSQVTRGFILPFAVLLGGIVLSIGLSVFNLLIKQVILASSGRESQFAFYAADTGGECALYWDAKQQIFPTSTASVIFGGTATCGGVAITPFDSVLGTPSAATTTFDVNLTNYCFKVTVAKWNNGINTKIESEGFNTCNTSDQRRVERAIRITY